MIHTPCRMMVDKRGHIHNGKEVIVTSPCYLIINGQPLYNCICVDGSGGGMIPENILKPIEK